MTEDPTLLRGRPGRPARFGAGAAIALIFGILLQSSTAFGVVWIATNEQRIADQFAVWDYEPSAVVAGYADRTGMTDEGRFLFYASRPSVKADQEFADACGASTEEFGVLGCYAPAERSITLFDVTDERLDGLEDVVAAHELLHAVWDRMSDAERSRLGILLDAEAALHLDDPLFAETLDFYAEVEPGQRRNELHSILGTEFGSLSPELEAHYARYLGERSAVVALHASSNAVFREYQRRADELVTQIEALSATIDTQYAAYRDGVTALNDSIDDFNARAGSGQFGSQAEFDAERSVLVARGAALDEQYAGIQTMAAQHEALLTELDGINVELSVLNQAINIEPPDIPELETSG